MLKQEVELLNTDFSMIPFKKMFVNIKFITLIGSISRERGGGLEYACYSSLCPQGPNSIKMALDYTFNRDL